MPTDELKTASQWQREGRLILKGSHAEMFRVNDDRTEGRGLFSRRQTIPVGADDSDNWTIEISASEWEQIKAERKEAARRPHVKVRKLQDGGTEVWCGPDHDIIGLLRQAGYQYHPGSRYWRNVNKDAEQVARAFEAGKIRGERVRVTRAWSDHAEGIEI